MFAACQQYVHNQESANRKTQIAGWLNHFNSNCASLTNLFGIIQTRQEEHQWTKDVT